MLKTGVYRGCRITDLDTLKNAITTEWVKITQDVITRSIVSFRKRLKHVVEVKEEDTSKIFLDIVMHIVMTIFMNISCLFGLTKNLQKESHDQ